MSTTTTTTTTTITTWTHPLDYVRRRRWTRVDGQAVSTTIPPPQDLHLI